MISKPTVLVLGAGASMPYGFPSGDQLIDGILAITKERLLVYDEADIDPKIIEEFRRDLAASEVPSIDAFLEYRPKFLKIGKLAITLVLSPKENDKTLTRDYRKEWDNQNSRGAWYHYLWQQMVAPRGKFGDNKVSFVTFNYDRSLERYFTLCLRALHGLSSDSEAYEELGPLNIVHIYGILGDARCAEYPYTKKESWQLIRIANNLRIIHDDPAGNPNFEPAKQLLLQAERICFLGYGFHELNNRRLRLNEVAGEKGGKEKKWFASRMYMTDVEFARRTRGFYHRFASSGHCVGQESDGALDILRKLPVL